MPKRILLVEDNENDATLFEEAVSDLAIDAEIELCTDGRQFSERMQSDENIPDLIFLDLNLPYIPGQQLLEQLQQHEAWRRVPVCILSSSRARSDVLMTYSRQANCYIAKPLEYDTFLSVVGNVLKFWLETVELPDHGTRSTNS